MIRPKDPTYVFAEEFISPQGEGSHTGRLMYFLRFAGCNVGRAPAAAQPTGPLKILAEANPKHTICETHHGQQFLCDTDYHSAFKRQRSQLIQGMKTLKDSLLVRDVCLTGGEPFLHDLEPVVDEFFDRGYRVHIETSGTKPVPAWTVLKVHHISCSPKRGYLPDNGPYIRDFKFVVDPSVDFDRYSFIERIDQLVAGLPNARVYLQPVNDVNQVNYEALNRIMREILPQRPTWHLSLQLHKVLGLR